MIMMKAVKTVNIRGRLMDFSIPKVMGILNVTDDSFFEGCRALDVDAIAGRVRAIRDEGADIIDIGACSTRPGFVAVDESIEWERLDLAMKTVRDEWPDAIISVDTFRASVADRAVNAHADIINDVSGGADPEMFDAVAGLRVPYIMTHNPLPASEYRRQTTATTLTDLAYSVRELRQRGVCDIILDPGFGFGKNVEENYRLMAGLDEFVKIGLPLLVGISRKSMIYRPLGITPSEALPGTVALNAIALMKGADILRVHDVAAAVQTVRVMDLLRSGSESVYS